MDIKKEILDFLKKESYLEKGKSFSSKSSLTQEGVLDSIGLIELIDFIKTKYEIEIPDKLLTPENFDSLDKIEKTIKRLR
jgi:acyl carrier protein